MPAAASGWPEGKRGPGHSAALRFPRAGEPHRHSELAVALEAPSRGSKIASPGPSSVPSTVPSIAQADKLTVRTKEGSSPKKKKTAQSTDDFTQAGKLATEADRLRADKFGEDHRAVLYASGTQNSEIPPGSPVRSRG